MKDIVTGRFVITHGQRHTKLYKVWEGMKRRCFNKNDHSYKHYGGKGIKVCKEWLHFPPFFEWAKANGYKEGLTIDRIDSNGNYEPKNCRWVSHKVQNRNYSRNHMITYNGETRCLADWADFFKINRATVLFRLKQGKPLPEVFSTSDNRFKAKTNLTIN
ncbi:MAG: hypothetical protein J6S85_19990 [Methanobrevibacter sp.]|nr:hypothetical protein [Methanobrevibacter sp.]